MGTLHRRYTPAASLTVCPEDIGQVLSEPIMSPRDSFLRESALDQETLGKRTSCVPRYAWRAHDALIGKSDYTSYMPAGTFTYS